MARYPISICMAGAVSAGAYTAGAMSVLLESLRLWESEDEDVRAALQHIAPKHRILIKGMTGASAGSIQAILSSLDMLSKLSDSDLGSKAWMNIKLDDLLNADDLDDKNKSVKSVLNTNALKKVTDQIIEGFYWAESWPPFLAQDYEIRLSITNLRGVPYNLKLPESNTTDFGASIHNEYLRYRFVSDADTQAETEKHYYVDTNHARPPDLGSLIDGGLASSAFPFAFEPVKLTRPSKLHEGVKVDIHDTKQWLEPLSAVFADNITSVSYGSDENKPSWKEGYGERLTVFAVDGGVTNNEPILEAFKLLSGDTIADWGNIPEDDELVEDEETSETRYVGGRVLFIDPFPNSLDKKLDEQGLRIDKQAGALKSALIRHARFSEPITFSKKLKNKVGLVFPSNPLRSPKNNEKLAEEDQLLAIKSGALGGFSGFLKPQFLHHDYALGRLNMQRFLRYHFTVPTDHPLVSGDANYINRWGVNKNGNIEVPIIPVFSRDEEQGFTVFDPGTNEAERHEFYWTTLNQFDSEGNKFTTQDRTKLLKGLKKRFGKVVGKLISSHSASQRSRYPDKNITWFDRWVKRSKVGKGISSGFVGLGWFMGGKSFLANAVLETVENSLAKQGLLDYRVRDKDGNEIKYEEFQKQQSLD